MNKANEAHEQPNPNHVLQSARGCLLVIVAIVGGGFGLLLLLALYLNMPYYIYFEFEDTEAMQFTITDEHRYERERQSASDDFPSFMYQQLGYVETSQSFDTIEITMIDALSLLIAEGDEFQAEYITIIDTYHGCEDDLAPFIGTIADVEMNRIGFYNNFPNACLALWQENGVWHYAVETVSSTRMGNLFDNIQWDESQLGR